MAISIFTSTTASSSAKPWLASGHPKLELRPDVSQASGRFFDRFAVKLSFDNHTRQHE